MTGKRSPFRWSGAVAATAALLAGALTGCAPVVDEGCPAKIIKAVLRQTETYAVDRPVDVASKPAVIGDLGGAPDPSCAFAEGPSASASVYAAVWVTHNDSVAEDVAAKLTNAAEASGLPLVAKVGGDDPAVNFMKTGEDGTGPRVIVEIISTGSALMGMGADESSILVILNANEKG